MSISVELTYEMSKELGVARLDADEVRTVADVVGAVRDRFGDRASDFDRLSRVAAVAVNGVLINHRRGMKTVLEDGDTVAFVKAAAGG